MIGCVTCFDSEPSVLLRRFRCNSLETGLIVWHHDRLELLGVSEEMKVYSLLGTDIPSKDGTEVAIDDTTGEVPTLNFFKVL